MFSSKLPVKSLLENLIAWATNAPWADGRADLLELFIGRVVASSVRARPFRPAERATRVHAGRDRVRYALVGAVLAHISIGF